LAPKGVRELPAEWPVDFSDFTKDLCRSVADYTMTSKQRIAVIEASTRYICEHDLVGDFVECGVAGGGSIMAMALTLLDIGAPDRHLWLYDTFAGMPEPTKHDIGRHGTAAIGKYHELRKGDASGWINISLETVKQNVARTDYPHDRLHFVQGKVEETLSREAPDKVALLRLDTDWYESTKVEMDVLFKRVAIGGLIIIDDYYRWQGCRKAVDDYVRKNRIQIFWSRIDDHSVIGVKQG
jgi:hypothetical protein